MNPVYRLFATINSFAPTVLRLVLAWVFAVHGGQNTLGWMGGEGWNATLARWTDPKGVNLPYWLAALGIAAEVCGAAGMLLGFCTRLSALLLIGLAVMEIGLIQIHAGILPGSGGLESAVTLGGIALALLCCGGGRFSVDRALTRALLPPNDGMLGAYKLHSNV